MTTRARAALADCEHALTDFAASANTPFQRPRWVSLITLLRTVGLVLKSVDRPAASPDVQTRIDAAWRIVSLSAHNWEARAHNHLRHCQCRRHQLRPRHRVRRRYPLRHPPQHRHHCRRCRLRLLVHGQAPNQTDDARDHAGRCLRSLDDLHGIPLSHCGARQADTPRAQRLLIVKLYRVDPAPVVPAHALVSNVVEALVEILSHVLWVAKAVDPTGSDGGQWKSACRTVIARKGGPAKRIPLTDGRTAIVPAPVSAAPIVIAHGGADRCRRRSIPTTGATL